MLSPEEIGRIRRQAFWSAIFAYPLYAFLILAGRLYFQYKFKNLDRFRRDIWEKLEAHDGPVIWTANHLTLIDSFLIVWAVFPWPRIGRSRLVPWSTPEFRNYYQLGGPIRGRAVRALMYLCRCIPFLREGEDEAAVRWREKVFEKCEWILRDGGSIFMYPEAGRERNGWLNAGRPKDFLGRLALEVPQAKFLCIYLRGDRQLYATVYPPFGALFRVGADLIPAVLPGETTPRAISQRLFDRLAALQDDWFQASPLTKNCSGNDVLDLKSPLLLEHFDLESGEVDPEWIERHLTPKETSYLARVEKPLRFTVCARFLAAKEAAHKALAQSDIGTPTGAFTMLEVDLFRRKATHLPTGCQVDVAFTDEDEDKLHCVAVLRGGSLGDDQTPGDVLWRVEKLPPGEHPGEFARRRCLEFIAESSDDIPSPAVLAFSEDAGVPKVLRGGKPRDWGVSLSHSGRFVAYSFMVS